MAVAKLTNVTSTQLVSEFKAAYQDALQDTISDATLAPLLLDSNFFVILKAEDQELFFATSNYLDEFLQSALPTAIHFAEERLHLWANEAIDFARQNASHESFVDIFSARVQYDQIIRGLIRLDAQGAFLHDYFVQIKIESVHYAEMLPRGFIAAVESAANAAVQPALMSLARFLQDQSKLNVTRAKSRVPKVNQIRASASFLNAKGAIPFSETAGRYRIQKSSELDRLKQYRPVIDRAIQKLVEARTYHRIDNMDRVLAGLLSEYHAELDRPSKEINVPLVWAYGLDIERRLKRQETLGSSDEQLDEDDLFDLRRLMTSHNLFLNCFDQSQSLLNDVESSAAIYNRLDVAAKRLSPDILQRASNDAALVEEGTAATLKQSVHRNERSEEFETKGVVALRLGLLRGLLHAAGGHLLRGIENIIEKSSVEISSKMLADTLRSDGSFTAAINFLHREAANLVTLSDQLPIYFGYLRNLLLLLFSTR